MNAGYPTKETSISWSHKQRFYSLSADILTLESFYGAQLLIIHLALTRFVPRQAA